MLSKRKELITLAKKIKKAKRSKKQHRNRRSPVPQPQESPIESAPDSPELVEEPELQPSSNNDERLFYCGTKLVLIKLPKEDTAIISANYVLKVLSGRVSCFGSVIDQHSNSVEVHSPGKHALPVHALETGLLSEEALPSILKQIDNHINHDKDLHIEIKNWLKISHDTCLLMLESKTDFEHQIKITDDIRYYNEDPIAITYPEEFETEHVKYCINTSPYVKHQGKKIMIVGDKNTGKSTFAVWIMNKILTHYKHRIENNSTFYLETDLGQNSFFFPGTVAMFSFKDPILHNLQGPCLQKPLFEEFIGEFSPTHHTTAYLKAIQNAINYYNFSNPDRSLVINTHGYVSGIGENILYDVIKIVEPDVLIILDKGTSPNDVSDENGYLQTNPAAIIEAEVRQRTYHNRANIVHHKKSENNNYKGPTIWHINSLDNVSPSSHKNDKKDQMMISYLLHNKFYKNEKVGLIPRVSQLAIATPIELPFDRFLHIVINESEPKFFFKSDFMKFSLVFICSVVSFNYAPALNSKERLALTSQECQELYKKSSSKGLGYVRDIIPDKRALLVVTPLGQTELDLVNLIVKSTAVQFSNHFYTEDSLTNIENWIGGGKVDEELEETKLYVNSCNFGIGSESYKNMKSLRKIQ